MKKLRMILSIGIWLLLITACTQEDLEKAASKPFVSDNTERVDEATGDDSSENPSEDSTQDQDDTGLPRLGISIQMRNFTESQTLKMNEALDKIKTAINSKEFEERVLAHTYKGEQTYVQNDGLSNREIYDKLMIGAESLNLVEDNEMDIDVTMYYKNNSVVGYTYPSTPRTWVNSKFFNRNSQAQVAKNVVHEWIHKLGFEHDFKRTSRRPYSVPYAIGNIIEDLIDELE